MTLQILLCLRLQGGAWYLCSSPDLPVLGAGDGVPPPLPLDGGEGGAGKEG